MSLFPSEYNDIHWGRRWSGPDDECPCPRAACGLVVGFGGCPNHMPDKTTRQGHPASKCPSAPQGTGVRAMYKRLAAEYDKQPATPCTCGKHSGAAPEPRSQGADEAGADR